MATKTKTRKERQEEAELNEVAAEGMGVPAAPEVVGGDGDDDEDITADASDSPSGDTDITTRLTIALERLAQRQDQPAAAAGTDPVVLNAIMTLAQAVERLTDGQMKGSELIANATKKANRPSNEAPPMISAFNPRGDKDFPKPALKCKMLLPWEAEHESLTREEVDLLNLLEPMDYIVVRNDRTKVKVEVRCKYNLDSDVPSILIINHDTAFNNDYQRMMPPLVDMLRSMLKQNPKTRAAEKMVVTDDEELEFIAAGLMNNGLPPEDGKVISAGE